MGARTAGDERCGSQGRVAVAGPGARSWAARPPPGPLRPRIPRPRRGPGPGRPGLPADTHLGLLQGAQAARARRGSARGRLPPRVSAPALEEGGARIASPEPHGRAARREARGRRAGCGAGAAEGAGRRASARRLERAGRAAAQARDGRLHDVGGRGGAGAGRAGRGVCWPRPGHGGRPRAPLRSAPDARLQGLLGEPLGAGPERRRGPGQGRGGGRAPRRRPQVPRICAFRCSGRPPGARPGRGGACSHVGAAGAAGARSPGWGRRASGCPLRTRGTPLDRAWPGRVCGGPLHARQRVSSRRPAAAWSLSPGSGRGTSGEGQASSRALGVTRSQGPGCADWDPVV